MLLGVVTVLGKCIVVIATVTLDLILHVQIVSELRESEEIQDQQAKHTISQLLHGIHVQQLVFLIVNDIIQHHRVISQAVAAQADIVQLAVTGKQPAVSELLVI